MTGRVFVARLLVRLYPERWREEYGEEMRAMLSSQHTGVAAFCNVLFHAAGENLRDPDLSRIVAVLLVCGQCLWILRGPAQSLPRHALSIAEDFFIYRTVSTHLRYLRLPGPWKTGAAFLVCWRCFWMLWPPADALSPHAVSVVSGFDFGIFLTTCFTIAWMAARHGASLSRGFQSSFAALSCAIALPILVLMLVHFAGLPLLGMDIDVFYDFSLPGIARFVFIFSAVFWGALLGRYLRWKTA